MDLYETYPDFDIDVAREQDRLRQADTVVLQHPLYWYATPALLKEYIDLVFAHGFAYGSDSEELSGKTLTQAISCGADEASYQTDGFNGFPIEELFRPMRATAHFCNMHWAQPFVTYGGHIISDERIQSQRKPIDFGSIN